MNTPLQDLRSALALLPVNMHSREAVVLLLAIQSQENPNRVPQQINGPAVGDYQHERGTIALILANEKVGELARQICTRLGYVPKTDQVYAAIRDGDPRLDAVFARLLLWADPRPLPPYGDEEKAWQTYLTVWRPGAWTRGSPKQRQALRSKWRLNYLKALETLK